MTSFIDTVPRSFENVAITDEGIDTMEFLEAAQGVVMLFKKLSATKFKLVIDDMDGNIQKIKNKYLSQPVDFKTLQNIILSEASEKTKTATQGLLWLKRGLEFTAAALLRSLENATEELSVSFTKAYDVTLKQYHNFIVKSLFKTMMGLCPYRKDFYETLGGTTPEAQERLKDWAKALQSQLETLNKFYSQGGYDKGL
ncbi:hypothetical protein H4219_000925 [Mycoemilia scoparia]|uniref:Glycolipid transfer protein domain-containing protein n=1 Tax=Mycoemilia scoparia TaxID=417184 RepID=A0A9W8A2G7_9FUNG|nr:hypothetical protein H4219_000925 [Mycoemilia scoparia]